jgi:uncharacterized membrane protein
LGFEGLAMEFFCLGFIFLINLVFFVLLIFMLAFYFRLERNLNAQKKELENHRDFVRLYITGKKREDYKDHSPEKTKLEPSEQNKPEPPKPTVEPEQEKSKDEKQTPDVHIIRSAKESAEKVEHVTSSSERKQKEGFFLKEDFEAYVGGRLLNRIGALALLLGIAFFLKFTFDHNLINEWGKTAIGTIAGLVFLGGGFYFHKKEYYVFSQGLVGIGIATLYLVFYAAYNFFDILPYTTAIVLMLAVTIIALINAVYYDSLAIGILGILGGFLTPFVLVTTSPDFTGLFMYITFINVLICTLLYLKETWRPLEFIGIIGSYLIYYIWFVHTQDASTITVPFLYVLITWLMYFAVVVSRYMYAEDTSPSLTMSANILLFILFYSAFYTLINDNYPDYTGHLTLILSVIYFASSYSLRRFFQSETIINIQLTMAGMLLLLIATEITMSGYASIIVMALEAVAFVLYGILTGKPYVWKSSLVIYVYTILKLFSHQLFIATGFMEDPLHEANYRVMSYLTLCASLAFTGYLMEKHLVTEKRLILKEVIRNTWIIILFIFLGIETNARYELLTENLIGVQEKYMNYAKYLTLALVWGVYSLPLLRYGIKNKITTFITSGGIILGIAILVAIATGYAFVPLSYYVPIMNIRFLVFIVLVAALVTTSYWVRTWIEQDNPEEIDIVYSFLRYTWSIMLFILFTVEVNDYFNKQVAIASGDMLDLMVYSRPMVLSILWTLCAVAFINLGLSRKLVGYIIVGFITLVLAVLASIFIGYTFSPMGFYVPYFNIRFLALAILVAGFIFIILLLKKHKDTFGWSYSMIGTLRILTSIFLFLLLSYEFSDVFNKEAYTLKSSMSEDLQDQLVFIKNLKQLTLSGLWLVYSISLMVFGIVKRIKILRLAAICFFGLTIVKIFIFDLSFLDQLYRIFSFIGLGVILLLVSYLYQRYKHVIVEEDTEI